MTGFEWNKAIQKLHCNDAENDDAQASSGNSDLLNTKETARPVCPHCGDIHVPWDLPVTPVMNCRKCGKGFLVSCWQKTVYSTTPFGV